jgi:Bacterial dipeptidyl-peptidase Sh3 domain/NlpC/P60 family
MAERYDPRVTAARPDLAARYLEGKVEAARFVDGVAREVLDAQTPVRAVPALDAALVTEALRGERVTVYEETDEGWCWGELASDGYVGWLSANALGAPGPAPTHRVSALRTLVYPSPMIKQPPLTALSLGTQVAVLRLEGEFAAMRDGFVPARHLAPFDAQENDFVAVAERFAGTPYLWGGKTSFGIDCSGLVQIALNAAGIGCPRDSDMQESALGANVAPAPGFTNFARGDLMFWKGHVAIVADSKTIVHANAFHMAVAIEPLVGAVTRIRAAGSELRSVKRIAR